MVKGVHHHLMTGETVYHQETMVRGAHRHQGTKEMVNHRGTVMSVQKMKGKICHVGTVLVSLIVLMIGVHHPVIVRLNQHSQ